MAHKQFFRSLPQKGFPLYWILLVYLVVGYFYPVIGFLAVICMMHRSRLPCAKGDGGVGMPAPVETFTTGYWRNTRRTNRFQHLYAPKDSVFSW